MDNAMSRLPRKFARGVLALGLVATLGSCESLTGPFEIPNQDEPNLGALERNPTRAIILATSQGLFDGFRTGTENQISTPAHFGREGYYVDPARTVLDEFDDPLVPSGGIGWAGAYNYIRTTNSVRAALDQVREMPDAEKEGVRGLTKTLEAFLLHTQLRVHDEFGIAVETDRKLTDPLAPIVDRAQAYDYIVRRLDEAKVHLDAAGGSFAFRTPPGFAGFNTPATFARLNRALKARVLAERKDYAGALTALSGSFLNPGGDLAMGVYNNYSTASGDRSNPFFDPSGRSYVADTMLVVDAQLRPNGEPDLRLTTKTARGEYRTHTRVTSNRRWTLYNSATAPIPLIKNEELVLLRAEARLFTGNRAGALEDINTVRVRSGGLAPLATDPGEAALLNELIYNRRYSLVFEFGHRWVDLRRFNRLGDLRGPRGPGDRVFDRVPFPAAECDQRGREPAGCKQVDGVRTTR
jgi:starch-binding outer membrane protein, SusD/RagB family